MATLDSTTTSEYSALASSADRAQAIVDALVAPVTVNVYNDSNAVVGTGTMASPWATVSGGTVVIGDVTGFAVTVAGTPNANWYLRFESGTRYVQASFGLFGSGQEAIWSLSNWTVGTQAGIRSSVLTCAGNTAPVWSGAPATRTFTEGVGGTYDFTVHASDPEGDSPLSYSMSPTYNEITFPNGVLTVTPAAVVATRNLTLRVTDPGGLYAEHPCAVTIENYNPIDYTTYASSYDETYYVAGSITNGWRSQADTVTGWDWSFPPQSPTPISGVWRFGNGSGWPSEFPGNRLKDLKWDWKDFENATQGSRTWTKLNELDSLGAEWDGAQVQLRGAVKEGTLAAADDDSAPDFLIAAGAPLLPTFTTSTHTLTSYDISNTKWYTPFREFVAALAGRTVGGYKLGKHPKLKGLIFHGVGASRGEEEGFGTVEANHVDTILACINSFATDERNALCWVGEGKPWTGLNETIVNAGIGTRSGFLERFLWNQMTPYVLDGSAEPKTGQVFTQYVAADGSLPSRQYYLTLDETHPPIKNIRYYMDEMEAFREGDTTKQWNADKTKVQIAYRMCFLRGLQMRRNSLAVENYNPGYNNDPATIGGAGGFINPALMKWGSVQLGRRVFNANEDPLFEANEAFCLLGKMYAQSLGGLNTIHNLERWLTQREQISGTGTTAVADVDINYNPSTDDPAPTATHRTVYRARTGSKIGFYLDDRMRFGSNVAVKVTYFDDVNAEFTLKYSRSDGFTGSVTRPSTAATGKVQTTTFFLTDFVNSTGAVNFRLDSTGTRKFMFVRVIKV